MEDDNLTREFVAKAAEVNLVGKADEVGDMLKAIAKTDSALADKVMGILKTAHARIQESGLFTEIGKENPSGAVTSAYDKIVAKAAELRKTSPALTEAQAFTKVYDSDSELREQYLKERNK
jgi:ABC-type thiamine transport system substrate-binding protein